MKKTTAQLRPGDILKIAREDGWHLYSFRGRLRHPEHPVFQLRFQPLDEHGKPIEDGEILYLAASAETTWLWVGMLVSAVPERWLKILEKKRGLSRTP